VAECVAVCVAVCCSAEILELVKSDPARLEVLMFVCSVLQCVAMCVAVCVADCLTMCSSVKSSELIKSDPARRFLCRLLRCVAVCVAEFVAVCCSVKISELVKSDPAHMVVLEVPLPSRAVSCRVFCNVSQCANRGAYQKCPCPYAGRAGSFAACCSVW